MFIWRHIKNPDYVILTSALIDSQGSFLLKQFGISRFLWNNLYQFNMSPT